MVGDIKDQFYTYFSQENSRIIFEKLKSFLSYIDDQNWWLMTTAEKEQSTGTGKTHISMKNLRHNAARFKRVRNEQ